MTGLDKPVASFLDRHTEVHNFIYQTRSYPSNGCRCWKPTTAAT